MKWTLMLELVDMDSNLRSTLAGFKDPVAPEAEGLFCVSSHGPANHGCMSQDSWFPGSQKSAAKRKTPRCPAD